MEEDLTLDALLRPLEEDVLVADFRWSILMAAACSYRHDSVLRPFPPMLLRTTDDDTAINTTLNHANGLLENRDYATMARAAVQMPSFDISARNSFISTLTKHSYLTELLQWTLNTRTFSLKSCSTNLFSEITKMTGQSVSVAAPDYIFAVTYADDINKKFDQLRGDRRVMYAYHGSRVENFHSILHYGLQGHLNKTSVFGEGTYLSSELSVCFHYSPMCMGWNRSVIGSKISCVAVCEIIDDESVKCKVHDETHQSSRGRIAGSIGGDVPEKYYIVQNNDTVRVKYILVYTSKDSQRSDSASWLRRHCFLVFLGLYSCLLLILAFCKSSAMNSLVRYFDS